MANANAQTHDIDLASPNLNLDKYKLGVSQFDGFNYRNSPFISHEIKNLYTKQIAHQGNGIVVNGDVISITANGELKKNDSTLHTFKSKVEYEDITSDINTLKTYGFDVADIRLTSNGYEFLCIGSNSISLYIDWGGISGLQFEKNYAFIDSSYFSSQNIHILTAVFGKYNDDYIYYLAQGEYTYPNSPTGLAYYFVAATENNYYAHLTDYYLRKWSIVSQKNNSNTFLVVQESAQVRCFFYNNNEFSSNYDTVKIYDTDDNTDTGIELTHYFPFEDGFIIKKKPGAIVRGRWICFSADIYESQNVLRTSSTTVLATQINTHFDLWEDSDNVSPSYDKFCPAVPFLKHENAIETALYNTCVYATINKSVSLDGYSKEYLSDDGKQMLRLLYNNGTIQGISALYLNSDNEYSLFFRKADSFSGNLLFEYGIISELYYCDYKSAIFKTIDNKFIAVKISSGYYSTDLQILFNRYVIAKTADFLNCYDLEENKLTHIADDWNNRFYCSSSSTPVAKFVAASVGSQFQAMFTEKGIKQAFPGRQANSIKMLSDGFYLHHTYVPFFSIPNNVYLYGIDVYVVNSEETNTPYYMGTYPTDIFTPIFPIGKAGGIVYANTDGNLIEPIPILCKYNRTSFVPIIKMLKASAFLFPIGIEYFGLYYLLQIQENFDAIFSIQSQLFAIANNYIWSVSYNNGIITINKEICSCEKLIFLCSTPISAFFWSPFNNTIYQFQGDNLLHRGQCIDEINEIIYVDYFENTNDICMLTDKYAIVLSEQYAYKIKKIPFSQGGDVGEFLTCGFESDYFWIKTSFWIVFYSYKQKTGYTKQNIIVKTQLYGLGDNMLSETDCVYIRVFNAENETGSQTVKVGGFTLTDKKTPLLERTFTITSSDWTDDGSYYIRYQPTYQKALGIQIEIESTVPITYIGVSNIPDTKMITKL